MPLDKPALRRQMRAWRNQLSQQQQQTAAQRLVSVACSAGALARAQRVAAYAAWDGEIDPAPLLAELRKDGKQIFLPIIRPEKQLQFGPWQPDAKTGSNRFGILEPDPTGRLYEASDLDIVLVPGVAFTRRGERLGMGGGYYDKLIEHCRSRETAPRWMLLAHAEQEVEFLPTDSWDQKVDAIISSREYIAAG